METQQPPRWEVNTWVWSPEIKLRKVFQWETFISTSDATGTSRQMSEY